MLKLIPALCPSAVTANLMESQGIKIYQAQVIRKLKPRAYKNILDSTELHSW